MTRDKQWRDTETCAQLNDPKCYRNAEKIWNDLICDIYKTIRLQNRTHSTITQRRRQITGRNLCKKIVRLL